jgi:eukaryotic-like serine/threonine-protein kinase
MAAAEESAPASLLQSRDPPAVLPAGATIGASLRVLSLLGRGGMGEVYEAEHTALGRRFAVKVLRAHLDAGARDRFRREWRTIARLSSEYVVSVIDCGELRDGTPYLVMERLYGLDLRQLLDEAAPLPIPRAVGLVEQACLGVAAAHRAGVVHRDLKPANLFVTARETGDELCKVLDFGVAKVETSEATQQGAVIGTIKYMAPEQLTDSASVGPTADIYALGAILYECLTGAPPHVAATLQETMFRILNESPAPLAERRPGTPPELAAAIERALSRDPLRRFESAEALARALGSFARPAPLSMRASGDDDTVAISASDVTKAPPGTQARRSVKPWIQGGLVGLGLGFGLAFSVRPASVGEQAAPSPAPVSNHTPSHVRAAEAAEAASAAMAQLPAAVEPPAAPSAFASGAPPTRALERAGRPAKPRPPALPETTRGNEAPPPVAFERENPYE